MNVRQIVRDAVDAIPTPRAEWVVNGWSKEIAEPREVFVRDTRFWVREDGTRISGYYLAGRYAAFRPGFFDRIRIRRAFAKRRENFGVDQ